MAVRSGSHPLPSPASRPRIASVARPKAITGMTGVASVADFFAEIVGFSSLGASIRDTLASDPYGSEVESMVSSVNGEASVRQSLCEAVGGVDDDGYAVSFLTPATWIPQSLDDVESVSEGPTTWGDQLEIARRAVGDGTDVVAVAPSRSALDVRFLSSTGLSGPFLPITVWTESHVYFPVQYAGLMILGSAPRAPRPDGQGLLGG